MPIIPATWEAGRLHEPRNSRPAWATRYNCISTKYGNAQTTVHKALSFKMLPWLDERGGGETDKVAILMVIILPGTDLPLS